jgi:hypothetical protein
VSGEGGKHAQNEALVRLSAADLKPLVRDGARRRIVNMVVHTIMATTAGTKIDRSKLENLLESAFDSICNGKTFNFQPVLKALLKVPGVTEKELYLGIVNLKTLLLEISVRMDDPEMTIDQGEKDWILRDADSGTGDLSARTESKGRSKVTQAQRLKLGDLLRSEGLISEADLKEALSFQERFGGKIGTNLVQLGLITEEALAKFLGLQLNTPCCLSEREINAIPAELIAQVPLDLAKRFNILPMGIDRQRLRLIMEDPTDVEVLDEVGFRTGHATLPVVAPEFLIAYGLEKHYGIKRKPVRLQGTPKVLPPWMDAGSSGLDTVARYLPVPGEDRGSGAVIAVTASSPPPISLNDDGPIVLPSFQEVELEPAQDLPPRATPPPPPATRKSDAGLVRPVEIIPPRVLSSPGLKAEPTPAPREPSSPATERKAPSAHDHELAAQLFEAEQEIDVYPVILHYFGRSFGRVAIFLVEGEAARGWMRLDAGGVPQIFRKKRIVFDGGSGVLSFALHSRRPYWGRAVHCDENREVLSSLELPSDASVMCVPFGARNITGFVVGASSVQGAEIDRAYLEKRSLIIGKALEIVRLRTEINELL